MRNKCRCPLRKGLSTLEIMVSATLLVAMIGLVAPIAGKMGRIAQSARYHRLAVQELSNQAERLTSLPLGECRTAIESLEVSQGLRDVLPEAAIAGRLVEHQDGTRLELELDCHLEESALPLTIVAWLDTLSLDGSSPSDKLSHLEAEYPRGSQP